MSVGDDAHRETKDGLPDPRLKYYKFMIVRHPLERLASAYLDLIKVHSTNVKKIKVNLYQILYLKISYGHINPLTAGADYILFLIFFISTLPDYISAFIHDKDNRI